MSAVKGDRRPLADFLLCLVGPIVWAAHLFLLYGGETLICLGPPVTGNRIFLIFAMILSVSAVVGLAVFAGWRARQMRQSLPDDAFLDRISLFLAGLSALGILGAGYGAAALPACAIPFA